MFVFGCVATAPNDLTLLGCVGIVIDLRRVHSVVVVVIVCSRVGILVEIHKDVLNLGLLRRIHYHHYRRSGNIAIDKVCSVINTWHWLVTDELAAAEVVVLLLVRTTTIMSVKCL